MLYMEDLQIICMSVDEIQKCDYSVEKYWAVTFHRAVYCAFWGGSNQAHAFDRPFNIVGGSYPASQWTWGWGWPCFDKKLFPFLTEVMLKKY